MSRTSTFTDADDLGVNWPLYFYEGSGAGFPHANGSQAVWSPNRALLRAAWSCGPYKDFATDTDNQVVEFEFGDGVGVVLLRSGVQRPLGPDVRNVDGTGRATASAPASASGLLLLSSS
jgi:hypothetical protein